MKTTHKITNGSTSRDPIEWVIIGIALAGANLVLGIKNKIDTTRAAKSAKLAEQARAWNRAKLAEIHNELKGIEKLLVVTREYGKIVINKDDHGIARRSVVFETHQAEERFNRAFDDATAAIGRINRHLSELKSDGFPLASNDFAKIVSIPLRKIQEKTVSILEKHGDRFNRLEAALPVISDCQSFIETLKSALNDRGS